MAESTEAPTSAEMNTVSSPECLSSLITTFKSFLLYIGRLLLKGCGPWERHRLPAWPAFAFSRWFLIFSVMTFKKSLVLNQLFIPLFDNGLPLSCILVFFPIFILFCWFQWLFKINVILMFIYLICCNIFLILFFISNFCLFLN